MASVKEEEVKVSAEGEGAKVDASADVPTPAPAPTPTAKRGWRFWVIFLALCLSLFLTALDLVRHLSFSVLVVCNMRRHSRIGEQ